MRSPTTLASTGHWYEDWNPEFSCSSGQESELIHSLPLLLWAIYFVRFKRSNICQICLRAEVADSENFQPNGCQMCIRRRFAFSSMTSLRLPSLLLPFYHWQHQSELQDQDIVFDFFDVKLHFDFNWFVFFLSLQ